MFKILLPLSVLFMSSSAFSMTVQGFETDTLKTTKSDLCITFIGHGTLMMTYEGLVIYVDPVSMFADFKEFPRADLILITHEHRDHLDSGTISILRKESTDVIVTPTVAKELKSGTVMKNGDVKILKGIRIEAVPAYNLVHKRDNGQPFHPKGIGNGYVLTIGEKNIYIAGDTENIQEMSQLKNIDVAFLPMNLPYTMTPEMVAEAARRIKPHILYPYHFGDTKTSELVKLLENEKNIEVRIRKLQ